MSRPEDVSYRVRITTLYLLRIGLAIAFLVGLLVGPFLLLGRGWAILLGMVLFTIGLFSLATARPLSTYPVDAFGIEHRVDEDTFDGPSKRCSECGTRTTQGLRRRYARQLVALGVPLHTLEWGVNDYCLACAEPGGGSAAEDRSSIDRVRTDDEIARRELERAFE